MDGNLFGSFDAQADLVAANLDDIVRHTGDGRIQPVHGVDEVRARGASRRSDAGRLDASTKSLSRRLPQKSCLYLAAGPTDLRKGFDGLCAIVEGVLGEAPLSGHIFLFANSTRTRLKVLVWDGSIRKAGRQLYRKNIVAETVRSSEDKNGAYKN